MVNTVRLRSSIIRRKTSQYDRFRLSTAYEEGRNDPDAVGKLDRILDTGYSDRRGAPADNLMSDGVGHGFIRDRRGNIWAAPPNGQSSLRVGIYPPDIGGAGPDMLISYGGLGNIVSSREIPKF